MARSKEPGTHVPTDPLQQDNLPQLRQSEVPDPFDEAAQQRLSKMIAEIATRRTKKPKRS
jgi:hypothetical protein